MWCTNCRQDVPGIAASAEGEGGLRCLRCGSVMLARPAGRHYRTDPATPADEGDRVSSAEPSAAWDAWELEERLRHVKRIVGGAGKAESRNPTLDGLRIDAAQSRNSLQVVVGPSANAERAATNANAWGAMFAWSGIAIGLAASTCGAVLTAWSFLAPGRLDLRAVGVPVLLVGQLLLVAGLLVHLQLAWRGRRTANVRPANSYPSENRTQVSGESRASSSAPESR